MSFKNLVFVFSAVVMSLLGALPANAQEYTSENLFYMVDSQQSYESFVQNADQISIVCPAAYYIDQYGVLAGLVDPRVLRVAKEKAIKVMPLFATHDQSAVHELLNTPSSRLEAIRLMLFYARQFGYYGWQFDIENIHLPDRDAYTSFYSQAADSLHKYGFKISMAVVKSVQSAPESGNPPFQKYLYENWRGGYDIPAIAKAGDFISFMTYDQHTSLTPPGPVAGLPWMKRMLDYLLSIGIPPEKISLGIPSYSDYWYPTWTEQDGPRSTRREIGYSAAMNLLDEFGAKEEWMSDQSVAYSRWEEGGIFNWLFIEDAKSFAPKLELAKSHRLRGISVWLLGLEDPGIWNVLRKEVKAARVK